MVLQLEIKESEDFVKTQQGEYSKMAAKSYKADLMYFQYTEFQRFPIRSNGIRSDLLQIQHGRHLKMAAGYSKKLLVLSFSVLHSEMREF